MDVKDRDIEGLLDIAGDDGGRPLSFGIDDVVRQGRRRTRIRRTGTMAAAAITAAAVVTGAAVWANSDRPLPAEGPVAGKVVGSEPRLLPDDKWVELDGFWFRSYKRVSHTPGILSGWVIEFAGQPRKGHGPDAPAPHAQAVLEQERVIDRGWFYPMNAVNVGTSNADLRFYPIALVRGDARSGVFTQTTDRGRVEVKATAYRLASLPGWTMLVGSRMPTDRGAVRKQTFDAYDASGGRLLHCTMARGKPPVCER